MAIVDPVIVIPGITASTLHDEYPIDHQVVWDMLLHRSPERIMPHPDDTRYEASLPARVRAREVFELAYQELIEELRRDLPAKRDEPVPVFAFAYDWRQRLSIVEEELARFIEEVIERTRLMRHYAKTKWGEDPHVSLIGHSMGGLIVTGYLSGKGRTHRVGKVATIATPYQGSVNSILRMTRGEGRPSEREGARLTPALYHLLPTFQGAVDIPQGLPQSVFDPACWQTSIIESIAEALRLYGADPPSSKSGRIDAAREVLKGLLDAAKAHDDRVRAFDPAAHGFSAANWRAFIGVGEKTWQRVAVRVVRDNPQFDFDDAADFADEWSKQNEGAITTGDGVVPLKSALPPFAAKIDVMKLSREDFEPLEIKDKVLVNQADLHGVIPNMNRLQRELIRFLSGAPGFARYR